MVRKLAAFNARDIDAFLAELSPDIEFVVPGASLRGREQVAGSIHSWWEAFPDGRLTERDVVAGSTVAGEGTFTGTHVGTLRSPGGDIPPTGKGLDLRYACIYEVRQGKIVSHHLYFDLLEVLTQLGVAPAPAHV